MSMPSIYLPIPCMLMRRAALFSASSARSLPLTFPQPGLDRPFHSSDSLLRVFLRASASPRLRASASNPRPHATRLPYYIRNASTRVDLVRYPVLDLLSRVAQVLERQLLEHLLLQRLRSDPQIQQLLGVVQVAAEIANVEFVHPRHLDRHLVLPSLRDPPQHMLHRLLHHVPVRAQYLLRHGGVYLLAQSRCCDESASCLLRLVHQIANTVYFVL